MVNWSGGCWRRWQLVVIVIALLISVGNAGCGRLSSELRQTYYLQDNHVLEFVPKHALLAGVLDARVTEDKAWLRSTLSQTSLQAVSSWLNPLNLDINQDIRPWLGQNIAFAITSKDLDRDQNNGRQSGYLLVTDTADGERLREFL